MGILAWLFGTLGGLCAVMGIVTATEIVPTYLLPKLTEMFWLVLSAILLLASIAFAVGSSKYE